MIDKLKGFFLVLLVVLLCLVFALQFGGGQAEGCTAGGGRYLAKVYDTTISRGDFDAAYAVGNFSRIPPDRQTELGLPSFVMNGLIDRVLLAREARKVGFEISDEEVMERFVDDGVVLLSLGVGAPLYLPQGKIPVSFKDKDGTFNIDLAKRYIQNGLHRSVGEFTQAQAEEWLAWQMRELVAMGVNVSDAEVWDEYMRTNNKASIKYARFSPAYFAMQTPMPDEDEMNRWIAENDSRLEEAYEANKHRYTNIEKQVRARHILLKLSPDASEEDKAAAREKLEALREQALGSADFAELAAKNSEDKVSAPGGGDLGYVSKGRMVPAFDEALFALAEGSISEVVETPFGLHIIKAEDVREGDVPKEEAKRELAKKLFAEEATEQLAQQAARDTLKKWRAEGADAVAAQLEASAGELAIAPKLEETGMFGAGDKPIPGLPAGPLTSAVFAIPSSEGEAALPTEPVRIDDEWVVFEVTERQRADEEAFDEEAKAATRRQLEAIKQYETVAVYLQKLREQAVASQALRINEVPGANGSS